MRYLILGAGPAGRAAAERIMELDPGSEVFVAFAEGQPYSRMYLPDLLSGDIKPDRIYCRFPADSRKKGITLFGKHKAKILDTRTKEVLFDNGSVINYDRLLIATGRYPDLSGPAIETDAGYHLLESAESVLDISQRIVPLHKAAVLGAGLAGIQTAVSLAKAGLHVTLLEKEPVILGRYLERAQADTLIRVLERKGIKTILHFFCRRIQNGRIFSDDNSEITFDDLFISCGTLPAYGFSIKEEILPDIDTEPVSFESKTRDIFAAGSILSAQCSDQAAAQGRAAASEMCGKEPDYTRTEMFVNMRGFDFSFYGSFNSQDDHDCVVIRQKEMYKKLAISGGRLSGFIFIGDSKKADLAYNMASERRNIGDAELRELLG